VRVLVAGAGAVGSWIGGALALGGADVVLAEPGPRRSVLAERGLTLHDRGTTVRVRPTVVASIAEATASDGVDLAIVAVKSYHTTVVAHELAAAPPTWLASFQNGVGNDTLLSMALPDTSMITATLTTGLWIDPSSGDVHGTPKGGVGLGAAGTEAVPNDLAEALTAGGLDVRAYVDPAAMKWSKLLLNLMGSATSAILGWPPARVFGDRRLFALERACWLEAATVLRALGLTPVALPGYPVPLYLRGARMLPESLAYRFFAGRLAGARGDRLPSVAADLAAGGSRTENDVLSGAVVRAGEQTGVTVPITQALSDLVDGIASGRIARDDFRGRPDTLVAHLGRG